MERSAERATGVRGIAGDVPVSGVMDAIESIRFQPIYHPPDGHRIQRDIVGLAEQKRDPAAIGDDGEDITGQEHAPSIALSQWRNAVHPHVHGDQVGE